MIIRKDDLESAVEHGVISAQAAQALSEFTISRSNAPRAVNEHFRLFSNFSEVFICLGLAIVFSAFKGIFGIFGFEYVLIGAVVFWLSAEFFVAKTTKMAPAFLSVIFSCFFAVKAFLYFTKISPYGVFQFNQQNGAYIFGAIAVALLIAFFRFRIPAIIALILPSIAATGLFLIGSTSLKDPTFLWPIGISGVAAILLGIWFDSRDPLRRSRQNAYAFWLFVIGSPMAVHPLFASIWLNADYTNPNSFIPIIFGLAILVTLLGLILDRRSLVASSLVYFTIGLGYASNSLVTNVATTMAITSLAVGSFVVILGVLWYRLRAGLLAILPLGSLASKIPPSK